MLYMLVYFDMLYMVSDVCPVYAVDVCADMLSMLLYAAHVVYAVYDVYAVCAACMLICCTC